MEKLLIATVLVFGFVGTHAIAGNLEPNAYGAGDACSVAEQVESIGC